MIRRSALVAALLIVSAQPVWALQRAVRANARNFSGTPVQVKRSQVKLVEAFLSPGQISVPDPGKARVLRYANRAGLQPSTYVLKGELVCQNTGDRQVEAVKLAIVIFNAFHEPVLVGPERRRYTVQQLVDAIPRNASKRIAWEQPVGTNDVYEVAAVITGVRFSDGSVWIAPDEELVDVF